MLVVISELKLLQYVTGRHLSRLCFYAGYSWLLFTSAIFCNFLKIQNTSPLLRIASITTDANHYLLGV